ncbi:uncharacterized protein LOC123534875 [Mercenaria mercenaria]|uniref:uncharacterized protein LOC123534875 n=1 Tax=Mercenaria mercenaria TaxID=6596 RepID=UPI00234EB451|nr:uncharacterized protein LOC123534875 [Mercenaria mercenaria]
MSSNRLLHMFTNSSAESPLDLTVKRADMDPSGPTDYLQKSFTTTIATLNNPMTDYSSYQQSSSGGYYETDEQYSPMYSDSVTSPMYTTPEDSPSSSQNLNIPTPPSLSAPSSPVYDGNQKQYDQSSTTSSILPKKRKNLWRPYDRAALGVPVSGEREGDSGSDSGSNSSSDQEFKTPHTPMDPMKRRKRNMLQYAEEHLNDHQNKFSVTQSNTSSSQIKSTSAAEYNDVIVPLPNNSIDTFVSSRNVNENPDVREQVISGMKKRDIFGWSLKLSKPPEDVNTAVPGKPTVCQDGDKTYFELQTVKKNSPEGCVQNTNSDIPVKHGISKVSPSKHQQSKNAGNGGRRNSAIKKQTKEVGKENNKNASCNRVYIQTKDNVIESFDETQNIPPKEETKEKLSLIDLIEEIEADALKQDKDEVEKTHRRNMGIVKLLEQCNHVKLQALDYLMSNVIIQEKGPSFKNQNETVQKMLKGDKIGSVNMLDVVELQVEMGLN